MKSLSVSKNRHFRYVKTALLKTFSLLLLPSSIIFFFQASNYVRERKKASPLFIDCSIVVSCEGFAHMAQGFETELTGLWALRLRMNVVLVLTAPKPREN